MAEVSEVRNVSSALELELHRAAAACMSRHVVDLFSRWCYPGEVSKS